jgi:hypothetical protein
VAELDHALAAQSQLRVTIAGQAGRSNLGRGHALDQWPSVSPVPGVGEAASTAFLAALDEALDALAQRYSGRVVFGMVNGDAASPTHLQVWGANARNWNLQPGKEMQGGGMACHMGCQRPGIFGIVTTPIGGLP